MALSLTGYQPGERVVSPGVFTKEIDQSALAQGVAAIGGVVVAPFPKGPGFYPTVIRSESDLTTMFGDPDGVYYGPYTAQQYLRQQGQVTVCRVGGLGGYVQNQALVISAMPGQYGRFTESGSFTGKGLGMSVLVDTSSGIGLLASWSLDGTVSAKFSTGLYKNSTMIVGDVIPASSSFTATNATGSTLVAGYITASLLNSTLPHAPASTITMYASVNVVAVSPCKNEIQFTGTIVGAYGELDPSSWTPDAISEEDACGNITGSSGRDEVVLAVLANTALDRGQNLRGFSGSILTAKDEAQSTDYALQLNEVYFDNDSLTWVSSSYGTYDFSIDPESSAYITSVFGTNPQAGFVPVAAGQKIEAAYTYKHFDDKAKRIVEEMFASGSWKIAISSRDAMTFSDGITPDVNTSEFDLRQAYTPFIRSQKVAPFSGSSGPATPAAYDLFKVHTISDGTIMNTTYKVEISNVKSAGSISGTKYGSFTLSVRSYTDNDLKPSYVERFDNLNLDPDSANYVARRIGDMYSYIDFNGKITEFGDFGNVSKHIRVEMATSPWPVDAIPYGFAPYDAPIGGDYARLGKLPAMTYCSASAYLANPGRYASGVVFQPAPANADSDLQALYPDGSAVGTEQDNKQYFAPVPLGTSVGNNVAFDLESDVGVTPLYVPSEESVNVKKRRFVLGFQGGFDGQSPSIPILVGNDILPTNQQGLDCSTNKTNGSYAYKQCLMALSNADEWDFNLITLPGINFQYHAYVASMTVEVCEGRGDAFYILDIAPNQMAGAASIDNVVELASQFDTSYAGTYYPWVKIVDTNSNKVIPVPPSVVMMAVFASNDAVAAEWFAPAGLNRGGIPAAVQVLDRLTHSERDTLYEGRVNPIASFPGQGVVAWGQKTLQQTPSALDRINVRRLLIAVKKFIASSSRFLVFEQNVATTRQRFLNIVNPYLEGVQQRSGIYAFKVKMDAENNTADVVDRNILYGQIWIQPAKTAEFVVLDFNVTPTGATFSA
jgi:hypothetical protein